MSKGQLEATLVISGSVMAATGLAIILGWRPALAAWMIVVGVVLVAMAFVEADR